MSIRFAAASTAILLAACSKQMQLPVHEFQVAAPRAWRAAETGPLPTGEHWWEYLGDAGLDRVIRKALDCNQSVRAAAERIEAAAQQRVIAGAADLPDLGVGANRLRQRQNFVGLPFPGFADRVLSNTYSNSGLSFNVSWEADFWNRIAADKLAADATVAAREADRDAVRLSISGQVAKAWFAAVEAERQIELARAVLAHSEAVAERIRERYRAGSRSPVDVQLAESDIARARVTISQRGQTRDTFVRQVEILACEYPAGEFAVGAELPELPVQVPAGLPSELVYRRPDLLSAERSLLSADARIVEARAALRPAFSLTSAVGTSSNTLLDLVNPGLQVWNYALGVAQPIFNRGRLKANVRVTEARAREAAAGYEDQLWTAYREVETALAAESTLREQEDALRTVRRSTEEAISLAQMRFGAGMADVFSVLNLRRTALDTDSAILGLRRSRIDNRIDLHLALGGGFPAGSGAGDEAHPTQ
jgi:NodT family efflux transporter outer membrane factor (OMF) lipoprotein